jgi:hypothetical protein
MIRRTAKRPSQRDALAALFSAYAMYGTNRFPLPDGARGDALRRCRELGWLWMPDPQHGVVIPAGLEALRPYGVRAEPKGSVG